MIPKRATSLVASLRLLEFNNPASVTRKRTNYFLTTANNAPTIRYVPPPPPPSSAVVLNHNQRHLELINFNQIAITSTCLNNFNCNSSSCNDDHLLYIQNFANKYQIQPSRVPQNSDDPNRKVSKSEDSSSSKRPSLEKQLIVYNSLKECLPKLFTQPLDYTIYNKELVFINNLLGKTTVGLPPYMKQVAFLRTVGHFKFAFVKFNILNMSHDVETARVTVRWRIVGISGLKIMVKFWKYKLWKRQELPKHQDTWYDGISYFDIGSDGLVYRHIADKMEEDKDRILASKLNKAPLAAAKLALLAAICPKPDSNGCFQDVLSACSGTTLEESTVTTLSEFLTNSFFL